MNNASNKTSVSSILYVLVSKRQNPEQFPIEDIVSRKKTHKIKKKNYSNGMLYQSRPRSFCSGPLPFASSFFQPEPSNLLSILSRLQWVSMSSGKIVIPILFGTISNFVDCFGLPEGSSTWEQTLFRHPLDTTEGAQTLL